MSVQKQFPNLGRSLLRIPPHPPFVFRAMDVPNVSYSAQACFSCYRAPPAVPDLKWCTGCRRIKCVDLHLLCVHS